VESKLIVWGAKVSSRLGNSEQPGTNALIAVNNIQEKPALARRRADKAVGDNVLQREGKLARIEANH
jgi:outer membrane receptor for Fe3+-dicitrate